MRTLLLVGAFVLALARQVEAGRGGSRGGLVANDPGPCAAEQLLDQGQLQPVEWEDRDTTGDALSVQTLMPRSSPMPSSATPAIVTVRDVEEGGIDDEGMPGLKPTIDIKLAATRTKNGLELAGTTKGGDASLVGKHPLAFP